MRETKYALKDGPTVHNAERKCRPGTEQIEKATKAHYGGDRSPRCARDGSAYKPDISLAKLERLESEGNGALRRMQPV